MYYKDTFPTYEPCNNCKFKDKEYTWCNYFDRRIIGDYANCKAYIKNDLDLNNKKEN